MYIKFRFVYRYTLLDRNTLREIMYKTDVEVSDTKVRDIKVPFRQSLLKNETLPIYETSFRRDLKKI